LIKTTVTGSLPDPNVDLKEAMVVIAEYLENSIRENFTSGGRPGKWPVLKTGEASFLTKTGALRDSIGSESGDDWAEAGPRTILPYTFVHQYGGKYIPQREYVLFQREDIDWILKYLGDYVVEFLDTHQKPIGAV